MTTMRAARLVADARRAGAKIRLKEGGAVGVTVPEGFPCHLVAALKERRDDVAATLRDEAEFENALRRWLGALGTAVVDTPTGHAGHLWGATRHGLIVDFGPGTPLLTLDPRDVVPKR